MKAFFLIGGPSSNTRRNLDIRRSWKIMIMKTNLNEHEKQIQNHIRENTFESLIFINLEFFERDNEFTSCRISWFDYSDAKNGYIKRTWFWHWRLHSCKLYSNLVFHDIKKTNKNSVIYDLFRVVQTYSTEKTICEFSWYFVLLKFFIIWGREISFWKILEGISYIIIWSETALTPESYQSSETSKTLRPWIIQIFKITSFLDNYKWLHSSRFIFSPFSLRSTCLDVWIIKIGYS